MRNRLFSLCPYFAMFPESFVARNLETYTKTGDYVFDPFCGRGTTILQALLMERRSAGTDTNPVAYCISNAKAAVPPRVNVFDRIDQLERDFRDADRRTLRTLGAKLPEFFRHAYESGTLQCLLFLQRHLNWKRNDLDCFLTALILGSLHGEMDKSSSYFSNQMPRTISTKPSYSVRYWHNKKLSAPRRNVFELLRSRAEYRFTTATPRLNGTVLMADARDAADVFPSLNGKVRAIITSPPYLNVTRYEEDQWLRLWFLGYQPKPSYGEFSRDDRHVSKDNYWQFLSEAWEGVAPLLSKGAVLICRLAGKNVTRSELTENLYETVLSAFPNAYMITKPKGSKIRNGQTRLFRPGARGCLLEVDYVFRLT